MRKRPSAAAVPMTRCKTLRRRAIDLVIKKQCKVNAGTYKWGNVHIVKGGTLEFTDAAIDFWAENILVENEGALIAGCAGTPIGTKGGIVTIHSLGRQPDRHGPEQARPGISCISDNKKQCGIPDEIWKSNDDGMGMGCRCRRARRSRYRR